MPVRNDNTTTPAYLGTGTGNTYPEQYRAYDPANALSSDPIAPGSRAILKNAQTGKWCQLVPVPTAPSMLGMQCDLDSPEGATPFQYTGYGLIYNGTPLVPEASVAATASFRTVGRHQLRPVKAWFAWATAALSPAPNAAIQGPGGVLVLKPSVDAGVWLKPAPANLTAAGVYSLQVTTERFSLHDLLSHRGPRGMQ